MQIKAVASLDKWRVKT